MLLVVMLCLEHKIPDRLTPGGVKLRSAPTPNATLQRSAALQPAGNLTRVSDSRRQPTKLDECKRSGPDGAGLIEPGEAHSKSTNDYERKSLRCRDDTIVVLANQRSIFGMAYTFETSEQSGIFVARVGGDRHARLEDNVNELRNFWSGVAAEMRQAGLLRLLAVISAQGAIRSLDIRTFYRRLGELGFKADMRVAIVFSVPAHERPVLEVGVEAAARDGWTICHFGSESEATAWL